MPTPLKILYPRLRTTYLTWPLSSLSAYRLWGNSFKLDASNDHVKCLCSSELKTEEGYSADIWRTYIPGDICPHNVRTMTAQHLPRKTYILCEMLCGHSAEIVRTYISRDICPHNIRTISFFGFQLRIPVLS